MFFDLIFVIDLARVLASIDLCFRYGSWPGSEGR
jgi:hypothetical protein